MVVEYQAAGTRFLDVLDRVLDKGIVIDAWIRFQLAGLDLAVIDARVLVTSLEIYLKYAENLQPGQTGRRSLSYPEPEFAPTDNSGPPPKVA
ncbi:MAG TPA: gas vesicle protein GvpJ [Terriglobales bacterium]|nr:gas vesicle protein GvpJ [Terriglobales bacterium]